MRDYYEILMVHERAIPEVIDRVYRVLARKYHPDVHPPEKRAQAERKMTELNIAYDALSNSDLRAEYDSQRIVGAVRPRAAESDDPASPTEWTLKCFNHPTRTSAAFCWECGRPICEMCKGNPQATGTGEANWRVGHTICSTCVRRSADLDARVAAGRRSDPTGPWHRRPM
ncbi:MAG TPA: DnaJ domain-containing protein, partial [Armatimonadota bacterium]|nr:DnaJ domain-containing protein [Armatimonadota bacterium]